MVLSFIDFKALKIPRLLIRIISVNKCKYVEKVDDVGQFIKSNMLLCSLFDDVA